MENAKQKAIEVAYGELYQECIDENGWAYYQLNEERQLIKGISPEGMSVEFNNFKQDNANLIFYWRPKSLSGIENNNNWISIHSEDDLPKGKNAVFVQWGENTLIVECLEEPSEKMFLECKEKGFTHYQHIKFPEKPIY